MQKLAKNCDGGHSCSESSKPSLMMMTYNATFNSIGTFKEHKLFLTELILSKGFCAAKVLKMTDKNNNKMSIITNNMFFAYVKRYNVN